MLRETGTDRRMMTDRVKRVVILGGGTAGWMTATALAKTFGRHITIDLLESDAIGIVGVGEATIPTIHWFNQLIGLDEAEFVRATKASFKLGIEFVDWARPGHRYFHPFGRYGVDLGQVPFHHRWLKSQVEGSPQPLSTFSLATLLTADNRSAKPSDDPRSILFTLAMPIILTQRFMRHISAALPRRRAFGVTKANSQPSSMTLNQASLWR